MQIDNYVKMFKNVERKEKKEEKRTKNAKINLSKNMNKSRINSYYY